MTRLTRWFVRACAIAALVNSLVLGFSGYSTKRYNAELQDAWRQQMEFTVDTVHFLYSNDVSSDHINVVSTYLSDSGIRDHVVCLGIFSQEGQYLRSLEGTLQGKKVTESNRCVPMPWMQGMPRPGRHPENEVCASKPIFLSDKCRSCHPSAPRVLGIFDICLTSGTHESHVEEVKREMRAMVVVLVIVSVLGAAMLATALTRI